MAITHYVKNRFVMDYHTQEMTEKETARTLSDDSSRHIRIYNSTKHVYFIVVILVHMV